MPTLIRCWEIRKAECVEMVREVAARHNTSPFLLFCDVMELAHAFRTHRKPNSVHDMEIVKEVAAIAMSRLHDSYEANSVIDALHKKEHSETISN